MTLGLVGRKVGMTRVFDEQGVSVPVTVLEITPNRVTQLKSEDTDGYTAVQVTFGQKKAKHTGKAEAGHFPCLKSASWSTSPVPQKVKVSPVPSNATILTPNALPTVTRVRTVSPALSVWHKIPAAYSRVSAWPANTATPNLPRRICKWCVLTPSATSCWSKVLFPVR